MTTKTPDPDPRSTGDGTDEIADSPTFDAALTRLPDAEPTSGSTPSLLRPGLRIGAYEIERELGSGGMGAVYLAHRADEAFQKKVAIKVARGVLASPEAAERFKRERQILARLEHPNIARILDGGATEEGLPYFVMEYVEGRPISAYCNEQRLDTAGRLRLFLQVCSAVQYAHHNLIVHRDIKPENILVTADGVPRLLDFGIAKLVDPLSAGEVTQVTSLTLTPRYASPEQIQGDPLSTATDVYSLGVLLYELLTGCGPYRLASTKPLDLMRAIVEQEPELPSAAADRASLGLAANRGVPAKATSWLESHARTSPPDRRRQHLRGDLDAILMTTLRKDPNRRYHSVEAFAEDIRAYLTNRPVSARRDSALYRAGKFVQRHRWAVLAAGLVIAAAIVSAASIVIQSQRVARERDRAERVSGFLVDLFTVSNPSEARGNTITAREVLDKGAAKIERELKEQPEVRADLMDTMANVYDHLGLYDQAVRLARESLAFRRQTAQRDPTALARTLNFLGNVLMDKGDLTAAEPVYRESLAIRRRVHGNESQEVAESLNNLAGVVDMLGRYEESEKLLLESLALKRKLLGQDDERIATTIANLGVTRYKRGDLPGAEAHLREALAIQRRVLGEDHPEVAFSTQSVAVLLDEQGRYAEAEKAYRQALAIQRRVLGQQHADIVTTLTNLANTLSHARRLPEADVVYHEALPMARRFFGDDSTDAASVLIGLADVDRQLGRLAEAETLARESARIRESRLGADHADTIEAVILVGRVLIDAGRFPEAEAPLLRGITSIDAHGGPATLRRNAREALQLLYERWGRPAEAARVDQH